MIAETVSRDISTVSRLSKHQNENLFNIFCVADRTVIRLNVILISYYKELNYLVFPSNNTAVAEDEIQRPLQVLTISHLSCISMMNSEPRARVSVSGSAGPR